MALEYPKISDLWRWRTQKVPIYGVGEPKKFRFMALENLKISDLWRWR